MDKKNQIALGVIGGLALLGLGYGIYRNTRGGGGIFDNDPVIPPNGGGTTPPGYIAGPSGEYIKVLPESDFKITQLISGYPTMKVGISVPASIPWLDEEMQLMTARIFQAQFSLGKWYPSVPSMFTEQVLVTCSSCEGTGLDYLSRLGYPGHNDPCPFCGGTGQVDISPPYPLDIATTISGVWPTYHLSDLDAANKGNSSSKNLNYKIGDGVFVPGEAVKDVIGSPWVFVGGITNQYINVMSRWYKDSRDLDKPTLGDVFRDFDYPNTSGGTTPRYIVNPMPTSYSIIDTEATNIDCGPGYYYDGSKCVPGTHPPNPYKNQKYDVCVVLYEEVNFNYVPRDYIVAVNAVTTGSAISQYDGSQNKPYLYVNGWQGAGYYMNIPNTNGSAVYVGSLEDFNNLV